MSDLTPITREEALLDGADLEPITRKEQFIKRIYDKTQEVPTPITREEWFLKKAGEGGGGVTVEQLNATENGTYSEQGKAYSPVIVEVPQTTVESLNITANGTYTAPSGKAYSPVTVNVEGFKKKSIANTPTDIASFNDGTANPMPSLEISIEPVQGGSGDPSPSNVRPISGWNGANITRCGKNLWGGEKLADDIVAKVPQATKDTTNKTVTYSGGYVTGKVLFDNFKPNTRYTIFMMTSSAANNIAIKYTDDTQEYISNDTITVTKANKSIKHIAGIWSTGTTVLKYEECGIFEGVLTVEDFVPYNGSTTSIPFHDSSDNPITVYGGTLNVTSGELTATLAEITIDGVNKKVKSWGVVTNGYGVYYVFDVSRDKIKMCDKFTETDTNRYKMELYTYIGSGGTDNTCSFILPSTVTTVDEANVWFSENPTTILYELATPQTYQLTPTQVSTLLGQNNIFADCGQILEGEYFVTL